MSENVNAIEDYLKSRPEVLKGLRSESDRTSSKHSPLASRDKNEVTSMDISEWLDKQSEEVIF